MGDFNQFLTGLLNQSPALGVAIMMNNYFHDVATALLAASSFCLYAIVRVRDRIDTPEATLFFLRTYRIMVTSSASRSTGSSSAACPARSSTGASSGTTLPTGTRCRP